MYVVTVWFKIHASHYAAFMLAMQCNACTSLATEPGCRQFDVCEGGADDGVIFLYEVYDSQDDFKAHLAAPHFVQFNAQTADWVIDKKVQVFSLTRDVAHYGEIDP
jgi:quinol monooxygenase YgiN